MTLASQVNIRAVGYEQAHKINTVNSAREVEGCVAVATCHVDIGTALQQNQRRLQA